MWAGSVMAALVSGCFAAVIILVDEAATGSDVTVLVSLSQPSFTSSSLTSGSCSSTSDPITMATWNTGKTAQHHTQAIYPATIWASWGLLTPLSRSHALFLFCRKRFWTQPMGRVLPWWSLWQPGLHRSTGAWAARYEQEVRTGVTALMNRTGRDCDATSCLQAAGPHQHAAVWWL